MEIEKLGVPTVYLVVAPFETDARHNANAIGMKNLAVKPLKESKIAGLTPNQVKEAGKEAAKLSIEGLTKGLTEKELKKEVEKLPEFFSFEGGDYAEAVEKIEKYFLNRMYTDGFPILPPTRKAVDRMLEGTDLPRNHIVGIVGNGSGLATVEKIAINAVMAGCLPQYMPVIIAAVEALTDPSFDLYRVQSTAGPAAPLLIVSGPKLIEDLNINDGFATIGPGWRANTTIGRAIRLILINIGYAWSGSTDMKVMGPFAKFTTLMAENEAGYQNFWEPLRVVEGFGKDQATVSVMTIASMIYMSGCSVETYFDEMIFRMKGAYNAHVRAWGEENLIVINPSAFDYFREARLSRSELQQRLYKAGQVPCSFFAKYRGVPIDMEAFGKLPQVPEWMAKKCKESSENLVPVVPKPEDLKIIVAGGRGTASAYYFDTWGFGKSFFTTKAVKLPKNWKKLLEKYKGWETPVIK